MNLLITGAFPISEAEKQIFEAGGYTVDVQADERLPTDRPEQYDAVVCGGLFLYNDISRFRRLSVIQLTSAGRDRLPADYVAARSITVFTAQDAYSIPMAEWAVFGLLNIYKNAAFFAQNQRDQRWQKCRAIPELYGKRAAVFGFGNAGREIAKRLHAFGCHVTAVDVHPVSSPFADAYIPIGESDAILPETDALILAMPLTAETDGYFDEKRLQRLKTTAAIVNVARGRLLDEAALCRELQKGRFLGAALDVFAEEPLPADSALWTLENVYITPHNSFVGDGDRDRLFSIITKNLLGTEARA